MRELLFEAEAADDGITAGEFLKKRGFSRGLLSQLKRAGGLTRGGELLRVPDRLRAGDVVRVVITDSAGAEPVPSLNVPILYEDEDVIAFDKPPNMPVHPSIGHHGDTLANFCAAVCPDSAFRPINRLDKDTTGVCLCAKNRRAASLLAKSAEKVYFAVVDAVITEGGRLDFPIGREDGSIIKRTVRTDGAPAVTLYKPVQSANGRTLLEIRLLNGRTHQIRVHFSHIGLPLCGDELYGGDRSAIQRQALHCGSLSFKRPSDGQITSLSADIPEDMRTLLHG